MPVAEGNGHFRPFVTNPEVCRWWICAPENIESTWKPFCCHSARLDHQCPTQGHNPYPQEDDSYE